MILSVAPTVLTMLGKCKCLLTSVSPDYWKDHYKENIHMLMAMLPKLCGQLVKSIRIKTTYLILFKG